MRQSKLSVESPRQRVLDSLAHRPPKRTPFCWGFGPTPEMGQTLRSWLAAHGVDWILLRRTTDDSLTISPRYLGPPLPEDTDIWGIVRAPLAYGEGVYNEIATYPLAGVTDLREIEAYAWPDPAAYDYEHFGDDVLAEDPEHWRARKLGINTCGNPFEIYCWMTGLEEAMTNLVLRPDVVHLALTKITDFFETKMRRVLAHWSGSVDILFFADDLGSQRNLLMSRNTYRRMLQPYHARLFSVGRELAPHAARMLHSDGAVFGILPDLAAIGLDVLEAVQVDALGMIPERLKDVYGDQLSFHGGISVQDLLPHRDEATVFTECHRLVSILGKDGGYIAAPTHAIQAGTPPENVVAMLKAVLAPQDFEAACSIATIGR